MGRIEAVESTKIDPKEFLQRVLLMHKLNLSEDLNDGAQEISQFVFHGERGNIVKDGHSLSMAIVKTGNMVDRAATFNLEGDVVVNDGDLAIFNWFEYAFASTNPNYLSMNDAARYKEMFNLILNERGDSFQRNGYSVAKIDTMDGREISITLNSKGDYIIEIYDNGDVVQSAVLHMTGKKSENFTGAAQLLIDSYKVIERKIEDVTSAVHTDVSVVAEGI